MAFGDDFRVQRFVTWLKSLDKLTATLAFGHSYVANLTSIPIAPENMVFVLRKAKPSEFDRSLAKPDTGSFLSGADVETFESVSEAAKTDFPVLISQCRIYKLNETEGYLCDGLNQRSSNRPLSYFNCRSRTTMVCRCMGMGCCGWIGPSSLLGAYYDFCVENTSRAAAAVTENRR